MQEERGEWYLAKQIAVGILIAAAVIFIGLHVYGALLVGAANKAAETAIEELESEIARSGEETRARGEARRIEQERKVRAERARQHELARKTQAAADRARAEQQVAAKKDQAWRDFYKPAKKCDDPPDSDTIVECGNEYIRAKREFETRWSSGDL